MSRRTPRPGPAAHARGAESRDERPTAAPACFMCAQRDGAISTAHGLSCVPCVQLCVGLVVRSCRPGTSRIGRVAGHG